MARILLAAALAFTYLPILQGAVPPSPGCKCLPGDTCWPSTQEWSRLNSTVGGRLVATVPLAAACHDPTFHADQCAQLKSLWAFPNLQ